MHVVVLVTAKNAEEARKIAKSLVEEKLIACANIVPGIQSHFWWEGKVCVEEEALMILKSRKTLVKKIFKTIKALHSYSVPEVIVLPIQEGNPDYLKWIDASTQAQVSNI